MCFQQPCNKYLLYWPGCVSFNNFENAGQCNWTFWVWVEPKTGGSRSHCNPKAMGVYKRQRCRFIQLNLEQHLTWQFCRKNWCSKRERTTSASLTVWVYSTQIMGFKGATICGMLTLAHMRILPVRILPVWNCMRYTYLKRSNTN